MERRDFLKSTGALAGIAAGSMFAPDISNALESRANPSHIEAAEAKLQNPKLRSRSRLPAMI